ncbi:PREDICTED: odorant receptor 13a-like [Trachymyrmex cornetzi]|uniref:odorant receptor 13a-like n=1 Tax=Trachymyrmex cornetzi TaxID=471704 RepID=UPI00084F1D39|nr:PREDICTED: odorant receptor 13a-like [Trachymyrmex cornetzi]
MAMDWKKNSGADFSTRVRTNKAVLSQNFAKTVFGIFSIAITLYTASVFTFDTSNLEETDLSMRPLILKMDFPFNSNTQFVYGLVLVTQFFCTVLCGCTVVTLNVLLVVLVLHLAGQIEILGRWFTKIVSEKNGHRLNLAMMRKIIEKHQSIITFSKRIENLYSDIALILLVSDSLIMCCIGFVLVTQHSSNVARMLQNISCLLGCC